MELNNEQLCAMAQAGDVEARNLLIENNLPFIRQTAGSIIRQYAHMDMDDLVQEGCLGLMEAVIRFRPERGTKFLTYAVYWIQKFMREAALIFAAEADSLDAEWSEQGPSFFRDGYAKNPERLVIEAETYQELHESLRKVSVRDRTYLLYRYGFIDGYEHSLPETAAHFHLTEKRTRSTERIALANLRKKLPR